MFAAQGLPDGPAEGEVGVLTVQALMVAAAVAADPGQLATVPGRLLPLTSAANWLGRDWRGLLRSGWPIFGALAVLRDSAWPTAPPACSAAAREFEQQLRLALGEAPLVLTTDY